MARNTSILLGEYFENFIKEQIATGKYSSVSEVVRTALRIFEQEETKTKSLINELKIGEKVVRLEILTAVRIFKCSKIIFRNNVRIYN
jgi:antitoxin ParD1/3/4